jgi:hypothetical protein
MTMNKHLVSFTWSILRLSSLCGLALALTGMTHAKTAKACYNCVAVNSSGSWTYACTYTATGGFASCYVYSRSFCDTQFPCK